MQRMSYQLTTRQYRERTKTVTRRLGWLKLKPGQVLMAVEKAMGLKRGETAVELGPFIVISVRREPLMAMLDDIHYGFRECALEGFGDHPDLRYPSEFIRMFCNHFPGGKVTAETVVTRIEFRQIPDFSRAANERSVPDLREPVGHRPAGIR